MTNLPFYLILGHKNATDNALPDLLHYGDDRGKATAAYQRAQINVTYKVVELATVDGSVRHQTAPAPVPAKPAAPVEPAVDAPPAPPTVDRP